MYEDNVILGQSTLLFVDPFLALDTPLSEVPIPGDFKPIVCLMDNSFDLTVNPIDTTSKCTGLWSTSLAGQKSGTFGGNAEAVDIGLATDAYNMDDLAYWAAEGKVMWWLQYNPNGTSIRYAKGFISAYNDTSPNLDRQTANFTVTLTGEIGVAYQTT